MLFNLISLFAVGFNLKAPLLFHRLSCVQVWYSSYLIKGLQKVSQVLCVLVLGMEMDLNIAIQKMSISDDKLLVLPHQATLCSTEKNHCSIMGRFLNPTNQRMSNWILDMPRICRLNNRVRGVALSQERFQFIFKSEGDLIKILKT